MLIEWAGFILALSFSHFLRMIEIYLESAGVILCVICLRPVVYEASFHFGVYRLVVIK